MKPIRVGVVGIGSMGRNHARVCAELPQIELAGIVDLDEARVAPLAEQYGTKYYKDYQSLYGQIDGVVIVSPTPLHYQIAHDFLEQGVHVLVEKPITVEVEQAKRLVALAKEKNLILQVGHLERFNPAIVKLKHMVGTPVLVECHRLSGPTTRNLDVGIIWDLMIHDFDILLSLYKSPAAEIHAMGTSVYSKFEDVAHVQIRFECGVVASLVASRNSGERTRCLKITENTGCVFSLDFINQTLTVSRPGPDGRPLEPEFIDIEKEEPLRLELSNFADCVANHKEPVVSGEDGERALELAVRVVESMHRIKIAE